MRETFYNTSEDCQWLRETHLAPKSLDNANPMPDFNSFILFGNEDCPSEIIVLDKKYPRLNDNWAIAILNENGKYSFSSELSAYRMTYLSRVLDINGLVRKA